jgi:NAD(P)-dependent dehydrogenase (short-subunit alcohol dehydrogenase family)
VGKDLFDITDKVAVVTGSTRGIELATAEQHCCADASCMVSREHAGNVDAGVAKKCRIYELPMPKAGVLIYRHNRVIDGERTISDGS